MEPKPKKRRPKHKANYFNIPSSVFNRLFRKPKYRRHQTDLDKDNNKIPEILPLWIAIVISVITGYFLWRQNEISKESLRVSNRAYLFITHIGIDTTGAQPEIKIRVENSGQTPALKFMANSIYAINFGQCNYEFPQNEYKGITSNAIIASNSHAFIGNTIKSNELSTLKASIDTSNHEIFLKSYGWFIYETIFSERCSTSYSFFWNKEKGGFSACPQNNEKICTY